MFETRRKVSDLTSAVEERNAKHYPEIAARVRQLIRKHRRSTPPETQTIIYSRGRSGKPVRAANRWPIAKAGNNTVYVTENLAVVSAPNDKAEGTYLGTLRHYILTLPSEASPANILARLRTLVKN